jgi:hypothetical protein
MKVAEQRTAGTVYCLINDVRRSGCMLTLLRLLPQVGVGKVYLYDTGEPAHRPNSCLRSAATAYQSAWQSACEGDCSSCLLRCMQASMHAACAVPTLQGARRLSIKPCWIS